MVKLFKSTDKTFNSNGDKILRLSKAKVREEDNGEFYLDLEAGLEYLDDIQERAILVAPTPRGEQAFRITNVTKTRKKLKAKANHVFYDGKNYLIKSRYIDNKSCTEALQFLNDAVSDASPFTVASNIETKKTYHCIRHSLCEAIETVAERWNGHLVRNNFEVRVMSQIGRDNGVTIRYAKNLKSITCEENWDDVVTTLLPVGRDGILLNDVDKEASVYVSAPKRYDLPYTKSVNFTQDIEEDDYKLPNGEVNKPAFQAALIADLKAQAEKYVQINCVPKMHYSVKMNVSGINGIGDVVEVIDERLGVNVTTTVISYEYDCILNRYIEIELGNFKPKLSNLIEIVTSMAETRIDKSASGIMANVQTQIEQNSQEIYNEIKMSKGVATAFLGSRKGNLAVSTKTILPLGNLLSDADGLVLSGGGIKISKRTNFAKISAMVQYMPFAEGSVRIAIVKNNVDNEIVAVENYLADNKYHTIVIPPILAPVALNDIIYVCYWTMNTKDIIENGMSTFLTVDCSD